MTTPQPQATGFAPIAKLRLILDSIRFEHTIFALPFAYLGMVLAADGLPTLGQLLWITVAMSSNRIIDRHLDAENPRTSSRPLPAGRLKLREMTAMPSVSLVVLLAAAAMLGIEPRLHRVRGYRHLPLLREALKRELHINQEKDLKVA